MNLFFKMKEWLRNQWWYEANHHIIVFLFAGIAAYFLANIGKDINAHWLTFIGGMVFAVGIRKLQLHYKEK